MINLLTKVSQDLSYTCGSGTISFDGMFPRITSVIILIIEVAVPVALIIFGMLDLGKAVIAQKDDDIKKGQSTFLKRLLAAALVFFVIFLVKIVIGLVASKDNENIVGCIDCFVHGNTDTCKLNGTAKSGNIISGN